MKKGQAAMEFLMTYGWAILVVLVAIGALAYFGVLSPSKFLPNSCTIEPGMGCDEFKVTDTSVQLLLMNGKGQTLEDVTVTIDGCAPSTSADWADGKLLGDATNGLSLTCTGNGAVDARFKKAIAINYTSAGGITHTASGEITTKVEA
ncbi:MAG: hypothetical protein KJ955_03530 [Nanoarchaeota archaeon]|nr:hypothetical protein [Nanoarchaeota archaeon]